MSERLLRAPQGDKRFCDQPCRLGEERIVAEADTLRQKRQAKELVGRRLHYRAFDHRIDVRNEGIRLHSKRYRGVEPILITVREHGVVARLKKMKNPIEDAVTQSGLLATELGKPTIGQLIDPRRLIDNEGSEGCVINRGIIPGGQKVANPTDDRNELCLFGRVQGLREIRKWYSPSQARN